MMKSISKNRFLLRRTIGSLMYKLLVISPFLLFFNGCKNPVKQEVPEIESVKEIPFIWEGANLYFLLTDRFQNGDPTNDVNYGRTKETGKLRGFEGGDIKGIIQKLDEGIFY